MPILVRTETFVEGLLSLSERERAQAIKALLLLAENTRHPSLQTHKIEGTDSFFEAYVNKDVRIIFERNSDVITLRAIGHHDILRKV